MTDKAPPPIRSIHQEQRVKPRTSPEAGDGNGGGDDLEEVLDPEDLGLEEEKPYKSVVKREFGRFELLIEMGRGGMAALYLARLRGPEQFEKYLAIKRIHEHLSDQKDFVDMFLDEARIAALLHHPNVATIFEFGQLEESYFISMEYVHGQNLTDILKAAQRIPNKFQWPFGVRFVSDAAKGLHAAHELCSSDGAPLGVVHRDVSPQNILVSYDGHLKVVDFGIAYAAEKVAHTAAGMLKGKAAYMSPEQTHAEDLDRRSDIFALGTVLFETVTQRRLFKEKNEAATLLRVREAEVPSPRTYNPDIPPELEKIILRALARNPQDRYDTAEELADQLDELLAIEGQLVSRQRVATLMDDLFYDRRKIKDKQIRIAADATVTAPLQGVAMAGTSSLSMVSSRMMTAAGLGTRTKQLLVMTAVLVVIAVVGFVWLGPFGKSEPKASSSGSASSGEVARRSPSDAQPEKQKRPRPDAMRPAPSANVTIKFTVLPKKAVVILRMAKNTYRGSVTEVTLARSRRAAKVVIQAKGYRTETLFVVPNEDSEIPITLKPAPRTEPVARPVISPMVRTMRHAIRRPMRRPMWRPMRRPMRRPKLKDLDSW